MAIPRPIQVTHIDIEEARNAFCISPDVPNEEFIRVPADTGYWCSVYSDALECLLKAKLAPEVGEAAMRMEHRKAQNKIERVTEAFLDACVATDPRYRLLREQVDAAEVMKSRSYGMLDAIRAKREMLISLGANMRQELQHAPSLRNNS